MTRKILVIFQEYIDRDAGQGKPVVSNPQKILTMDTFGEVPDNKDRRDQPDYPSMSV